MRNTCDAPEESWEEEEEWEEWEEMGETVETAMGMAALAPDTAGAKNKQESVQGDEARTRCQQELEEEATGGHAVGRGDGRGHVVFARRA